MPKITTIDPKSSSNGLQIKAKTQPTPFAPKVESKPAPTEGQSPITETKTEAIPLDPQHEALAKKESALRARERDYQAKEAALDARVKAAVDEALGQYRAKLKSNTLDVLNDDVGLTYDQLVEQAVNQPDPTTRAINQKLESIEKKQSKFEEDSQNAAKAQRDAAIKQLKYDASELVESDPEFETIKGANAVDDVVDEIVRYFDETGHVMTVEQAARKIENELLEDAVRIASLKKVQARLKPELTPEMVSQSKPQDMKQATTLTNTMSSSKPMSARERAIAVMEGRKIN